MARSLVLLAILASTLLAVPAASALGVGDAAVVIRGVNYPCDVDDDLYQHCQVGPVGVVFGRCFGVAVGGPASCIIGD